MSETPDEKKPFHLIRRFKNENIQFDVLYYCLIGSLGLEKTKEFLENYYRMKEEIEEMERQQE